MICGTCLYYEDGDCGCQFSDCYLDRVDLSNSCDFWEGEDE